MVLQAVRTAIEAADASAAAYDREVSEAAAIAKTAGRSTVGITEEGYATEAFGKLADFGTNGARVFQSGTEFIRALITTLEYTKQAPSMGDMRDAMGVCETALLRAQRSKLI